MGRSSVTGGQTCAPPTFTIDASTDVTKGKVTNNGDGTFSYDPNGAFASLAAGQSTTDSFLYTVKDAAGAPPTPTGAITITRPNHPPVAAHVTGTALEHAPPNATPPDSTPP